MPSIARGSRARSRRQAEEDNIEEGDPTQRSRTEDVDNADEEGNGEDEDALSRRASKKARNTEKVKKEKVDKAAKVRKRPADDEGEGGGEEEEGNADTGPSIDIKNFQDQPLSRADGNKVAGIASDWDVVLRSFRGTALTLATDVAAAMAEAAQGRDGESALKELDQMKIVMRDLLDTQAELKAHHDVLDEIRNDLARGEKIADVLSRYERGSEDRIEGWNSKTSRQKYAKDEDYATFMLRIFEVEHPDEGMPPMTDFINKEDGDESEDEDIVVGGVSQVYTCPITLTPLVEPVTSLICKHNFSKAAIEEYFSGNRSTKKKCPASGCNKMIGLSDLKPNKDLEKLVKAHLRRERQREAEKESGDDDAEEIID